MGKLWEVGRERGREEEDRRLMLHLHGVRLGALPLRLSFLSSFLSSFFLMIDTTFCDCKYLETTVCIYILERRESLSLRSSLSIP